MERTTFIFYTQWADSLQAFPPEVRLEVYEAIIAYAKTGELVEMSDLGQMAFAFVKPSLDENWEKYDRICERNRANGQKGGRPKKTQENQENPVGFLETQKNPAKPSETQQNPKNLDYDNDNDINNIIAINSYTSSSQAKNDAAAKIDVKAFAKFFNDTMAEAGAIISKVKVISGKRKGFLHARLAEYGKEALATVVRKAAASAFLNGGGDRAFVASFEWLFRPNNFPKVLEGTYDNRQNLTANGTGNTAGQGAAGQDKRRGTEIDNSGDKSAYYESF